MQMSRMEYANETGESRIVFTVARTSRTSLRIQFEQQDQVMNGLSI